MSSSEPTVAATGEPTPAADLTIADAARAVGSGRHLIRAKLQAGAFPNAAKDDQGFWRIPEHDLLAAGLSLTTEVVKAEPETASEPLRAESDELGLLRLEVTDLRHRLERADALLEAERKLSEERARALDAERATAETLYVQITGMRPKPKVVEKAVPRGDWQASMRAARDRDAQLRAEREREAERTTTTPAAPEPAKVSVPEADEGSATVGDTDRRPRWRRR